jgi:hypothetical protein
MLIEAAHATFAALLMVLVAAEAGCWIDALFPPAFSKFDRLACSLLGGLGIVGVALFIVGQFAFTPTAIMCLLLPLALLGITRWLREVQTLRHSTIQFLKSPLIPKMLVGFVLLLTITAGFAEITGDWGNDAVAYHLLGPKVWLRNGIIRPVADNCHTAFPATVETLYGALMALGGQRAAGCAAVFTLAFFFMVVFSLSRRAGLTSAQSWWAVALVACMPAVYAGAHSGFVDVLYAGFVLAAGRIALDAQRASHYAVLGLFCGLAMGTKYTGLLAAPALIVCACVLAIGFTHQSWAWSIRNCSLALAVGCAVAAPFYVRNWVLLGSPIYPPPPVLSSVFHAKYFSAETIREFHSYIYQRGAGMGRDFAAFVLLPFNLTYYTSFFHGAGGIGISALALGPLGVIASRRNPVLKMLALLGVILTILWFLTQQESRFLIHVYVLTSIFSVIGWHYAVGRSPRYAPLLCGLVIGLSIVYGLFMITASQKDEIHAVFSKPYEERRRQQQIPYFEGFGYLNGESKVQRVLILDRTVPPFYSNKAYVKAVGQWGEEVIPDSSDISQLLGRTHELGVTHVLDVESSLSGFRIPPNTGGLQLVFERPKQRIYLVN